MRRGPQLREAAGHGRPARRARWGSGRLPPLSTSRPPPSPLPPRCSRHAPRSRCPAYRVKRVKGYRIKGFRVLGFRVLGRDPETPHRGLEGCVHVRATRLLHAPSTAWLADTHPPTALRPPAHTTPPSTTPCLHPRADVPAPCPCPPPHARAFLLVRRRAGVARGREPLPGRRAVPVQDARREKVRGLVCKRVEGARTMCMTQYE